MSVRVRDLEIALVLAREMKAAAARSVDASLRLDQLQEVFGVESLDRTERARIQTALQMAGLEPFPSLLEADPAEPIRFGASKAAVASAATTAAGAGAPGAVALPEEPPAADPPPTFPTVGEFARSKLRGRSRRRFGVRRGDHVDGDPPLPPPPPAELVEEEPAVVEEEPAVVEEEPAVVEEEPAFEEPHAESVVDEPLAEEEHEPEVEEDELAADEEPIAHDQSEPDLEPEPEPDEREFIPLVPEQQAPPLPEPEPVPVQAAGMRVEDVVAVLLPAVAIPVIVTSFAGWRFGLPFVALSVIATGWLLGRREGGGGVLATLRGAPAAGTVLKTTAAVTVLSVGAWVALASIGSDNSSTNTASPAPAKKPGPAAAKPASTTPAAASKPAKARPARPATPPSTQAASPPSTQAATPPPDPATQGLIRVPPSQAAQRPSPGTTTTPSQTTPGAAPSTGTHP
jgi:chemotaxis protein histidine kinase CheA